MSYARNNPSTTTLVVLGLVAAGGLWWWKKKKDAESSDELLIIDDYAPALPIDQVTTESGAEWIEDGSEGWVEEASEAAVASLPSEPGSVEAKLVMSSPDPSPAAESQRGQTAIKLAKTYMISKSKKLSKPKQYKWKTKRAPKGGRFVIATRKSDGAKIRFAVKQDGKVVRLRLKKKVS